MHGGPVRHGGLAQHGVALQVSAAGGIIAQHFQRGAGEIGRGSPAVDGVPCLLRCVLQGENQAVARLEVFDFELSPEEMAKMASLNQEKRYFNMTYQQIKDWMENYELWD